MTAVNAYSDAEYVFTPHARTMPNVREYLEALWDRRQFIKGLAEANIRRQGASTTLGNLWRVLSPLLQAAIYFFLYKVMRGDAARSAFLPILIANFFLFSLTMTALGECASSIKQGKGLLLNSTFPRALLPLTTIYTSLRSFVAMAAVLVVIFPLLGGRPGPGLFVLPLVFVIHVVMNVGIALLTATVVTLVPDASNAMQYVSRLLFFSTPVIYPVTLLPAGMAAVMTAIQPVFAVFTSYQLILTGGMPRASDIAISALWAAGLLVVGGRLFLKREREFALYV